MREVIKIEITELKKNSDNEHTTYQNLWDLKQWLLTRKFTALNTFMNKKEE